MSNLVDFPSYIYEKERALRQKEEELFALEQELSYESFVMDLDKGKQRSLVLNHKAKVVSLFAAGFITGIMSVVVLLMLYM
tara:strand:- start:521 stop:763 length:243 start_codon:yes stop_codon:yes gene_type:complete